MNTEDNKTELTSEEKWGVVPVNGWETCWKVNPDVIEVVRCKKCFYAIPYNERWTLPKKNNCMWCKRYEDVKSLDWFCADGERRDDGNQKI